MLPVFGQGGPAASGQLLLVAESGPLWAVLVFLLACCVCSVSVCVEFVSVLAGIARQAVWGCHCILLESYAGMLLFDAANGQCLICMDCRRACSFS